MRAQARRPRSAHQRAAGDARLGDPPASCRLSGAHRRPPRPQPRGRRADDRAAPHLPLPAGHHRVRHRPPGLRPQAAHRSSGLHSSARARRPVRIPLTGRVRPRRCGELPCLHRPVLGRRHRPGQPPAGPRRAPRRRRHRGRRHDRGNGLGGPGQHRRLLGPPPGHRRQRQRPLLRPHHRGTGPPPRRAAHQSRLRACPVRGQADAPVAGRPRPGRLRRPARTQTGAQGRPGSLGLLRGPGDQVHRTG